MNKIETGGPAFPTHEQRFPDGVLSQESEYGMTLRDYFAAKAMQAAIEFGAWSDEQDMEEVARMSYRQAEAMLKARK